MRLRTQLIFASFFLAILPLTAIVLYSYRSSRSALENAYRSEAARMTKQMDGRLASIRGELESRLAGVSALPLQSLPDSTSTADPAHRPVVDEVVTAMSDVAPLVNAVEFQPEEEHALPAPPAPPEAVVIDVPKIAFPQSPLPADYEQRQTEIRELSARLAQGDATLSAEERDDIRNKIQQKSADLQKEMSDSREKFRDALRTAMSAQERQREAAAARFGAAMAKAAKPQVIVKPQLSEDDKARIRDRARKVALLLGREFAIPVQKQGRVVGHVAAQISPDEVIRRVLGTSSDEGEIPFAIDREGHFYTRNDTERATLAEIGFPDHPKSTPQWIVVIKNAGANGLRVGVARRVGDDLEDLRRTAGRNFGYGLALVLIALIGIVPIANHMTRDVSAIAQGAERVAHGDLQTRVPVRSKNEVGQLAVAFNQMTQQLSEHQQQLVEQRVLAVEYERKAGELEEARRFQLSMLPKEVPRLDRFDVAVFTQTATEVGGDYYDFHVSPNGAFTVAIGDATGHGAKAGTMVTVIKTLFSGYGDAISPSAFLGDAATKIKRMDLGRMAMALCIAKLEVNRLTVASAGMPPVLVHRAASNTVEEVALEATPLGTLGTQYIERAIDIASGDTIVFMSDGFPELTNAFGVQLGYVGAADAFASAAAAANAQDVIDRLVDAARAWHGDDAPNDDMTFVAMRVS